MTQKHLGSEFALSEIIQKRQILRSYAQTCAAEGAVKGGCTRALTRAGCTRALTRASCT